MPATRAVNTSRGVDPGHPKAATVGDEPSGEIGADALDARARKRVAVGLSPKRPTAKAVPQRPPAVQTVPMPPALLALILMVVVAVTGLLVWSNLAAGRPAWWPSGGSAPAATPVAAVEPPVVAYALRLGDDFSAAQSALRQGSLIGEWRTELVPDQSVYRMTVWPNRLAWSLLGVDDLRHYRLQTSVVIDAASPSGYAGLMVRHKPNQGFLFFAIDGSGRYSVQAETGEGLRLLQPWTSAPFLHPAPSANMLTVEDSGDQIRFYANQSLLYTLMEPALPVGFVGLAAGAGGAEVAEIRFDWFQLYDAVNANAP